MLASVLGLTMDYQLTVPALLRRAEAVHGAREVVSRLPDGGIGRTTYGAVAVRARKLAVALQELGIGRGDRVATFGWNHSEHLEAYFGVPAFGGVLHTLNVRLHADELAYIATHAGDRAVIVDAALLPALEAFRDRAPFEHVIVVGGAAPAGTIAYEELLAAADEAAYVEPELDEREAAVCCYTSGTTGAPKGVLYSHRCLVLHTLSVATVDSLAIAEREVVLPVVPMFHANAWGLPYAAAMAGAKLVLPAARLDPASLLELLASERVTISAGVPTVYLALLQALDAAPGVHDLGALHTLVIGGSAAPPALIEGFQRRHGIAVLHAWGMTELSPIGTIGRVPAALAGASEAERFRYRARQGRPVPFVELRARGDDGLIPWDGSAYGELEVRGPTVSSAYTSGDGADNFTVDGWFSTGDIVTIDPDGTIEIQDRAKDLIKSGGEWISSVALENALMGHPAVAEAAVVAVPDERWGERPLAVVVLRDGVTATADELRAHLDAGFARWWLPDEVVFADAIPKTATGKFKKTALRDLYRRA